MYSFPLYPNRPLSFSSLVIRPLSCYLADIPSKERVDWKSSSAPIGGDWTKQRARLTSFHQVCARRAERNVNFGRSLQALLVSIRSSSSSTFPPSKEKGGGCGVCAAHGIINRSHKNVLSCFCHKSGSKLSQSPGCFLFPRIMQTQWEELLWHVKGFSSNICKPIRRISIACRHDLQFSDDFRNQRPIEITLAGLITTHPLLKQYSSSRAWNTL